MIWLWIGFLLFVTLMLALDLGVFHRKAHVVSVREALGWSAIWITLSLSFTLLVYFLYSRHIFGIGDYDPDVLAANRGFLPETGAKAAIMYLNGYLTEWSLSVDNIFVIAVIFAYFRIPAQYQHRVLFWGIIGAVVLRGVFILAGAGLIQRFHWMIYVFGLILLITAVRLLFASGEHDPSHSRIVRFIYRHFPVTDRLHGQKFFVRRDEIAPGEHVDEAWDEPEPNGAVRANGAGAATPGATPPPRAPNNGTAKKAGRVLTPLGLVLLVVEFTDLIFAVDSIPAIFGITTDSFLVFTSNIFAILGLRAMYFALAGIIRKFHHLQTGLALVLAFIAIKMLASGWIDRVHGLHEAMPYITLGVIVLCIAGGIVASLLLPADAGVPEPLEAAPPREDTESGAPAGPAGPRGPAAL